MGNIETCLIRMALRNPIAMAGRRKEEIIVAGDVVAFVGGGTVATGATPGTIILPRPPRRKECHTYCRIV